MGAHLARAVRSLYPGLNLRARLMLTGMAISALDPDEKTQKPTDVSGRYFGSVDHRIELCGPIAAEPDPEDTSAEAQKARAQRKTRRRVDATTIHELLTAGAIVMLRPPARQRPTVYGLNLDLLTASKAGVGGRSYVGKSVDWRRYARRNECSTGALDRMQPTGPSDAAQGSIACSTGAPRGGRGRGEPDRGQPSARLSSHQGAVDNSADDDEDDPALAQAKRELHAAGQAGTTAVVTTRHAHPTMPDRDLYITAAGSLNGQRRKT